MPCYSLHVRALLEHVQARNTLHARDTLHAAFSDLATGTVYSTVHHGVSTQILLDYRLVFVASCCLYWNYSSL